MGNQRSRRMELCKSHNCKFCIFYFSVAVSLVVRSSTSLVSWCLQGEIEVREACIISFHNGSGNSLCSHKFFILSNDLVNTW